MSNDAIAEPATAGFDVLPEDPYALMRAAVEQMDRDARVCAPGLSRRAAKKLRRQVRVSSLTAGMLRNVGALPPAPVVAPAWKPSSYSTALMIGGLAGG